MSHRPSVAAVSAWSAFLNCALAAGIKPPRLWRWKQLLGRGMTAAARPALMPALIVVLAVVVLAAGLLALLAWPVYAQDAEQALAPSGLSADLVDNKVTLTWDAPSQDAASVTSYEILRRQPNNGENSLSTLAADTGSADTRYVDESANEAGERYVYRVKALRGSVQSVRSRRAIIDLPADYDPDGSGEPEPTATPTPTPTPEPESDPADLAPTGLSAQIVDGRVSLSWTAPAEDAGDVTGYEILRSQGGGDLAVLVADTGSTATGYTDSTANTAGETYAYRVKALRGNEASQKSNLAQVQIPHPPEALAPSGLTATATHDSVTLSWTDPNDADITGYRILRAQSTDAAAALSELVADTGTAATTYVDTAVEAETSYVYRIEARSAGGLSDASEAVVIETAAAPAAEEPAAADLPADTTTTGVVAVGGSVLGDLEVQHDVDWYRVELAAGTSYRIDMRGSWTGEWREVDGKVVYVSVGTLHDPMLLGVHYASGVLVPGSDSEVDGIGLNSRIESFTPAADGVYYIAAGSEGGWAGTYELALREIDPVAQRAGTDTDPVLLAPSGLSLSAQYASDGLTVTGLVLSWTAPAEQAGAVTGYALERSVGTDGFATLVADTGSDATTYTDASATAAGETYVYRVAARRDTEQSQFSVPAGAVIPGALLAPPPLTPHLTTALSVVSDGPATATATATADAPGTVYLRYAPTGTTDWSANFTATASSMASTTDPEEVTIAITGLTANAEYDVEASQDNTFPTASTRTATFTNRPLAEDFALDRVGLYFGITGNDAIWAGLHRHLVSPSEPGMYAYDRTTKLADAANNMTGATFTGGAANTPYGLWSDATTMLIVDTENDQLLAIDWQTQTRLPDQDVTTLASAGNDSPFGVWADNDTVWVSDGLNFSLYAYSRDGGSPDASKGVRLHADNTAPRGIWSDGTTMWVVDEIDWILYAYSLRTDDSFGTIDSALNLNLDSLNAYPQGLWSDGAVVYVLDSQGPKVYAYYLPEAPERIFWLDATSSGPTEGTVTAYVADADGPLTVNLRYRKTGETAWTTVPAASLAAGDGSVEIDLSGLEANGEYELEASLDAGFPDGVRTFASTFTNSPRGLDVLHVLNFFPTGLWSDGETLWVAQSGQAPERLYAYNRANGRSAPGLEFDGLQAAGNDHVAGIWSDGDTMFAVDRSDDHVYAYFMMDDDATMDVDEFGLRDKEQEFPLARTNNEARGIWGNAETVWVSEDGTGSDNKLYAYRRSDGLRDPARDIGGLKTAGNEHIEGVWSDGTAIWAADRSDDMLYAHDLRSGARRMDQDVALSDGNGDPKGVWGDVEEGVILVADDSPTFGRDRVFGYFLPRGATALGGVDFAEITPSTAKARVRIEYPDGSARQVHLRIRLAGDAVWPAHQTMSSTTGQAEFDLTGLTANVRYEIEVAFDAAFTDPLTVEFTVRPAHLDLAPLDAQNDRPRGVWGNAATIWVAEDDEANNDRLYAYRRADGTRDADRDLTALAATGNRSPRGAWSDGETLFVADRSDGHVYAYRMTDDAATPMVDEFGQRDESAEFALDAGNDRPTGLWGDADTVWVAEDGSGGDNKLYAYRRAGGSRDADRDLDTLAAAGNRNPEAIWSDGDTTWVVDGEDSRVYAYDLRTGLLLESQGFALDPDNGAPRAMWGDAAAGVLWVGNTGTASEDRVYAYFLSGGEPALVQITVPGITRTTATVRVAIAYPSGVRPVYLRYRLAGDDDWEPAINEMGSGRSIDFTLAGLSVHERYELEASFENDFPAEATIEAEFTWRPSHHDLTGLSGAGNRHSRGIWSNGDTMYVADAADTGFTPTRWTPGCRTRT